MQVFLVKLMVVLRLTPKLPWDPHFKTRRKGGLFLGIYRIVEPQASDVVLLQDLALSFINSDTETEELTQQVMGLRMSALARSLRTRAGRVPFSANNAAHLALLAEAPTEQLVTALAQVSDLSGLTWVSAADGLEEDPEGPAKEEAVYEATYSKEEVQANPS